MDIQTHPLDFSPPSSYPFSPVPHTVPNTEAVLQLARACIARGQARLAVNVLEEKEKEKEKEGGDDDRQQQSDSGSDSDESEDGDPDQRRSRVIVPGDLRPAERGGAQHLSLSRTAYLRSHHIDPFVADLRKALSWATR